MGPSGLAESDCLGAGKKPEMEEREYRKGGSVRYTGHGSGDGSGQRSCQVCFPTELGMRLGDWISGNTERSSVDSLPVFLVGMVCGLIRACILELWAVSLFC